MKTILALLTMTVVLACNSFAQGVGGGGVPASGLNLVKEFQDWLGPSSATTGSIGSPSGNSAGYATTVQDANHPGNFVLNSGTVTATGEYVTGEPSGAAAWQGLNAAPGWYFDTIVYVPVLPATTAAAYEVGLYHNPNMPQNSGGGQGFYLSSANSVKNDWYCSYGANVNTDSGIAAAAAWTHLTMISDGTNLIWYIGGVQVCTIAVSSLPSVTEYVNAKAENLTGTTSVALYLDEYTMQRNVTR